MGNKPYLLKDGKLVMSSLGIWAKAKPLRMDGTVRPSRRRQHPLEGFDALPQ
jgi:hypothetical protein